MRTRSKVAIGLLATVLVAGTAGWFSLDKETRGFLAAVPTNRDLLFWSSRSATRPSARSTGCRCWRSRGSCRRHAPSPLPPGPPLKLPIDVDAYMAGQRSAALLVLHDGKLRLERYGLGFDAAGRWTSFSVAKSITSTLVGAALRDGSIRAWTTRSPTTSRR
jgi:CubicO group peptidase (beta-lactamase class C family)